MNDESRAYYLAEVEAMRDRMREVFDSDPEALRNTIDEVARVSGVAFASTREAREVCGPIFEGRSTRELRKFARVVVMCSDCKLVIGLVIPIGQREVLLTKERGTRRWRISMWLDSPFWGDETWCSRRKFALHLDDLAAFEGPVVRVEHSFKDISAID